MSQHVAALNDFHMRLSEALHTGSSFSRIPDWIQTHTKLKGRPWTFKDHEFQLEIARDTGSELVGMKCSQIGMSELQVRITLALLAIKQGFTAIYVLPTRTFAQKFAKGRIDPVIEESDKLSELIVSAADGSEMKRIGLSTLYIGGANTSNQAISIPADVLVRDEYDFCNPVVLGQLESRLRHAENGGFKRDFSTPTVPGYGVSLRYDASTKGRYLVRCPACNGWTAPDFARDIVIPGFNGGFDDFDVETLDNPSVDIDSAFLACERCRRDLYRGLIDPSRREWVHERPSYTVKGYSIRPFDVPKYNSVPSVLRQIEKYETRQDYMNFVHGLPHRSKHSEMDVSIAKTNSTVVENLDGGGPYWIGVDVGKVLNVAIGRKEAGRLIVVRFMRLSTSDGLLVMQLSEVFERYRCVRMVIDSAPDFSLCKGMQEKYGNDVHPAVYIKDTPKRPKTLEVKDGEEDDNIVLIQRTKAFDALVKENNEGRIDYPRSDETSMALQHFVGMKRAMQETELGEKVAKWVKIPGVPDHYLHALMYLKTAIDLDDQDMGLSGYPVPYGVAGAAIGGEGGHTESVVGLIRQVVGR